MVNMITGRVVYHPLLPLPRDKEDSPGHVDLSMIERASGLREALMGYILKMFYNFSRHSMQSLLSDKEISMPNNQVQRR